jgi:hypothetical protein
LLYTEALLEQSGARAWVLDAHLEEMSLAQMADRVASWEPDLIVLTTAPSYLFWRCPPPELEVPSAASAALRGIAPLVAIGPHGSATPGYVLEQLGCHGVIRGEPELELVRVSRGEGSRAMVWADRGPETGDGR